MRPKTPLPGYVLPDRARSPAAPAAAPAKPSAPVSAKKAAPPAAPRSPLPAPVSFQPHKVEPSPGRARSPSPHELFAGLGLGRIPSPHGPVPPVSPRAATPPRRPSALMADPLDVLGGKAPQFVARPAVSPRPSSAVDPRMPPISRSPSPNVLRPASPQLPARTPDRLPAVAGASPARDRDRQDEGIRVRVKTETSIRVMGMPDPRHGGGMILPAELQVQLSPRGLAIFSKQEDWRNPAPMDTVEGIEMIRNLKARPRSPGPRA